MTIHSQAYEQADWVGRCQAAESRAAELEVALRETVGTLRRIHVRIRVNDGVDLDWIEQLAKFMLDRWGGKAA